MISTPLDPIVSQFPSIIIERWHDVAEPDAVSRWNKTIVQRWGPEPVGEEVRVRLRSLLPPRSPPHLSASFGTRPLP